LMSQPALQIDQGAKMPHSHHQQGIKI